MTTEVKRCGVLRFRAAEASSYRRLARANTSRGMWDWARTLELVSTWCRGVKHERGEVATAVEAKLITFLGQRWGIPLYDCRHGVRTAGPAILAL